MVRRVGVSHPSLQPGSCTLKATSNTGAPPPRKRKQQNTFRQSRIETDDGCVVYHFDLASSLVALRVPDVTGLSLRDAALAYVEAGWFVLPVEPGEKSPGSVVGSGWQHQSSRDPAQIREWWDEDPGYGIALHLGPSGAVAFDLDNAALDQLPREIADGLRQGVCQLSRRDNPDRGHYVFVDDQGYGNGAGAFRPFGDVRGKNGVIVVAPTPHVKEDGEYRWMRTGDLPVLPEALRACLSAASDLEAEPLSDAAFDAFVAAPEHNRTDRPRALDGVLAAFEKEVRDGGSSHESLVRALPWAFREVCAGCYPATEVIQRMQEAFNDSFGWKGRNADGRARPASNEFLRTAMWAAALAKLADPAETLARLDRDDPAKAVVDEDAFWSARPELAQLRQFAHARMVSPWAMLGCVLTRVLSGIPPYVVLPPIIGGHMSLNSYFLIADESSAGKSAAMTAAREFLAMPAEPHTAPAGSGEGLLKLFAYTKVQQGTPVQTGLRDTVSLVIDEGDAFTAHSSRTSGSTLLSVIKEAWNGGDIGRSWSDQTKVVNLMRFRYRLSLVMGLQYEKAEPLFADTSGFPQRLVWFPASDASIPDEDVAEPDPVELGKWPGARDQSALLDRAVKPSKLEVLAVPPDAERKIKTDRRNAMRGKASGLDGHRNLAQLKVAAALMWFNGRTDKITDEDWELAAIVMAVSSRTRARVQVALRNRQRKANDARGRNLSEQNRAAARRDAELDMEDAERVRGASARVRDVLAKRGEAMSWNALAKACGQRWKPFLESAVKALTDGGLVTVDEVIHNGQPGRKVRLNDAEN